MAMGNPLPEIGRITWTTHPGWGGGHLPQVWVSTVKLTPKAVAVRNNGRRWDISKGVSLNYHYGY